MTNDSHETTRRDAMKALGGSIAVVGVGTGVGTASAASASVATREATDIADIHATLHGDLTDLGGASSADVYFEYTRVESDEVKTSDPQTATATGEFSKTVGPLFPNTEYEYRAVADVDGTTVTGDWREFRTILI